MTVLEQLAGQLAVLWNIHCCHSEDVVSWDVVAAEADNK